MVLLGDMDSVGDSWWRIADRSSIANVPSWNFSERERDPSGCRASGLTPELPVHVVLVPPLLVPPLLVPTLLARLRRCFIFRIWFRHCFVFRRWYRWRNVNRIAFAIFCIALRSFVFARCGGYRKAQDFTRAGHRIVQSTLLLSFLFSPGGVQADVYPKDTSQWSWTIHLLIAAYTTDNSASINTVYGISLL